MAGTNRQTVLCPLLLAIVLVAWPAPPALSAGEPATEGPARGGAVTPAEARRKIAVLYRTGRELDQLGRQPLPGSLKGAERENAEEYNLWLIRSGQELTALAREWEAGLGKMRAARQMQNRAARERSRPAVRSDQRRAPAPDAEGPMYSATKEMQEMNRSFSLQYLNLQQKIQQETREFNLLSNIMKTKHEAAKNAINNIR